MDRRSRCLAQFCMGTDVLSPPAFEHFSGSLLATGLRACCLDSLVAQPWLTLPHQRNKRVKLFCRKDLGGCTICLQLDRYKGIGGETSTLTHDAGGLLNSRLLPGAVLAFYS
eukprot:5876441-Amphidinium_carterae.1